jgi:hypothetical protein
MGARQAGMGYAGATVADEWSLFNSIGGLGKLTKNSFGFCYEAVPSLIGADRMAAVYNSAHRWGNWAIGAFRFGDALYSEQMMSAGFSNQFGITSLGAKINYLQYRAEGFGTRAAMSVDLGGITQLTRELSIGAYITNLTQSTLQNQDGDRLPTQLVIGLGIKPSKKVYVSTELQKDIDYQPTWRTGIEYTLYKTFLFRTGYNFNPQAAFFGLGFHKKNLKVDYAIRFNQLPGSSHQATATYVIPTKEKK